MGHGADHAGGGAAGELGVGVEGDDESDGVEDFGGAALGGEAVVVAEDELVEVEELTALALPSHPGALAGVEGAMAMKEEEGAAALAGVLAVEVVGEGEGEGDEGVAVFGLGAGLRVGKVGEEAEVEVRVLVGEIAGLEIFKHLANAVLVEEEGGDDDEGGVLGGDAVGEVELGQGLRLEDGGDDVVDEVGGALGGGEEREEEGADDEGEGLVRDERSDEGDDEEKREDEDAEDVEVLVALVDEGAETLDGWRVVADLVRELGEAAFEEVVADVRQAAVEAGVGVGCGGGVLGEAEGGLGDFELAGVGVAGELGDAETIAVAGLFLHAGEDAGGVGGEGGLEGHEGLEDVGPLELAEAAEAVEGGGEGRVFDGGEVGLGEDLVGAVQEELELGEFEGGGEEEDLAEAEGVVGLAGADVDGERVRGPDALGGGEVALGEVHDARDGFAAGDGDVGEIAELGRGVLHALEDALEGTGAFEELELRRELARIGDGLAGLETCRQTELELFEALGQAAGGRGDVRLLPRGGEGASVTLELVIGDGRALRKPVCAFDDRAQ